jgi:hypothetical protein
MAGMYPDNQNISVFGKEVSWPGVDPDTGKFTNGSFSDPLKKPSFIPAETVNLVLDNLAGLISKLGVQPNNSGASQVANLFSFAADAMRVMVRDAGGRAKAAAPVEDDDVARKAEVDAVIEDTTSIHQQLEQLEGKGGYLNAHNFGVASPTLEELLEYACADIWGNDGTDGVFTFHVEHPETSSYAINGVTHLVTEIFNATKVTNLFDNNTWALTNTPKTDPAVFSWANIGNSTVALANDTHAGLVKGGGDITIGPDGKMLINAAKTPSWCPIPVGCLHFDTIDRNPSTIWPDTTWSAFAQGRTILGVGNSGAAGAVDHAAGDTGGEETHTLTIDEMPSHKHTDAGHQHTYTTPLTTDEDSGGDDTRYHGASTYETSVGYANIQPTGGGQSHNNMPPYIVTYIWLRTA